MIKNHVLGLKKVYYSYDNENWNGLEREGDYNHWTVSGQVKLPIYLKFQSITGEEVLNILNDHALYDETSTDIFSFKTFVKLQDIIKKDATIVASSEISKQKESFAKLMSYLKIDKEIIF